MTQSHDFDSNLLLPLFRHGYSPEGLNTAFGHKAIVEWLMKLAKGFWSTSGVLRDHAEVTEFAVSAVARLWEKVTKASGLRTPKDEDIKDPKGFVARVFRNLMQDIARKPLAAKRGSGRANESLDAEGARQVSTPNARDAESALFDKRALARVLRIARDPETKLTPTRLAAFLVYTVPHDLAAAEADAAIGPNGAGFVRAQDATLDLVNNHICAQGLIPVIDTAGQHAVAWITRCREDAVTGWPAWVEHDGGAARKALDTVQTWYRRARDDIKKNGGQS